MFVGREPRIRHVEKGHFFSPEESQSVKMNKGKTWKPLAISWRLFPFLLMQLNACFAWMRAGISFFQKCWRYLTFLLWEGSRSCKLSPFLGLEELKCGHLCGLQKPSAWARFRRRLGADTPRQWEKRKESPRCLLAPGCYWDSCFRNSSSFVLLIVF